jgi:hypothetical protein
VIYESKGTIIESVEDLGRKQQSGRHVQWRSLDGRAGSHLPHCRWGCESIPCLRRKREHLPGSHGRTTVLLYSGWKAAMACSDVPGNISFPGPGSLRPKSLYRDFGR